MAIRYGLWYLRIGFLLFLSALIFGYLAANVYKHSTSNQSIIGFLSLRPLHVSSAYFGIITIGIGSVTLAIQHLRTSILGHRLQLGQFILWVISLIGIYYSYFTADFGGREYWEFNPIWALPLGLSFFLFLIFYLHQLKFAKSWPVYYWMWLTGIVFFIFCFIENYLWIFPYFQNRFITDLTIQWKVNGAIVGAINQIIYGIAFYLMEKISGSKDNSNKNIAFAMYFLGLFNLMFNWGHHIYIVPTEKFIHYIAYIVSMTEWIILIRIFYLWNRQLRTNKLFINNFPFRFLMASDYWVMFNLILALLMSIPMINLFTHGTHITVAHAMSTTIGINTMIVIAASFYFIQPIIKNTTLIKYFKYAYIATQATLLVFIISLIIMGIKRSIWYFQQPQDPFRVMFISSLPYMNIFIFSGFILMVLLGSYFFYLLITSFKKSTFVYLNAFPIKLE